MKIVSNIHKLKGLKDPVLTFGFFDGFHLGHQKLVNEVIEQSGSLGGTSLIVTYWPHPRAVINSGETVDLIYNRQSRLKAYELMQVDYVLELEFNKCLAQTKFSDFIDLITKNISPKVIVVGKNHRFGKDRQGDYSKLLSLAKNYQFKVVKVDPVYVGEEMVSSSLIRNYLKEGNINMVNRMLGRKYEKQPAS
jgi:riboflavin kinase/FMN adenylyltransferase